MQPRQNSPTLAAFLVCGAFALSGCSGTPTLATASENTQTLRQASAQTHISATQLERDVRRLASDEFAGRGPGSAGDSATQAYLVSRLTELGLQPVNQLRNLEANTKISADGWRQPFELIGINSSQPPYWAFDRIETPLPAGVQHPPPLQQNKDYIVASGIQSPLAELRDAELVFVGYGIQAPEYGWDDFKGVNLRGKVLVMLNNDPHWDPKLFAGERRLYYGRWTYKFESAARQGAAGAIIIHTESSAGYPWQVVQTSWSGTQFELPAAGEPQLPVKAWMTQEATRRLLQQAGINLDSLVAAAREPTFRPVALPLKTSMRLSNQITQTQSANVIGIYPGSDRRLRDEWVVITAHHDHLGQVSEIAGSDHIYNGARDNAAGVAVALGLAEAWTKLASRPKRSLMVALVGAEEQGLLGSLYLSKHLPVPAGRIAANVNFDGGNIWGPTRDVGFIGYGKSTLDEPAEAASAFQQRVVKGDQHPDKGYFYRSDQLHFARAGVPALFVRSGLDFMDRPPGWGAAQIAQYTTEHYHQPSDEIDESWDFRGMVQDATFGYFVALLVANNPEMPKWYPGDEFEAARLQSLQAREASR